MGIDTSVVFARTREPRKLTLPFSISTSWWDRNRGDIMMYHPNQIYHADKTHCHDDTSILLFVAGKVYPIIRVDVTYKGHYYSKITKSFKEYIEYLESFEFTPFSGEYRYNESRKQLEDYFSFSKDVSQWMIDNNLVIAKADYKSIKEGQILVNPVLKEYDFQKILDPYTLYQELTSWVSGVLTNNPKISEISNDIKIQQAGFDLKTSFRKGKEK